MMVDSTHRYMMGRVAIDTIGAAMSNGRITEFRIGSVLRRSLGVLGNNLVPFGVLSTVFMAPQLVLPLWLMPLLVVNRLGSFVSFIAMLLFGFLMYFLLSAVLVYGTIAELRGNRASIGQSIRWVLGLLSPIIGVAIVATLVLFAGGLLLVVPGLVLWTIWWVAVPAAVVERTGVVESLRRSAGLTSGYRWRIFGIMIIIIIVDVGVRAASAYLQYLAILLFGDVAMLGYLIWFAISIAATAFFAVAAAVCYHDLRVLKDGVDVDEFARVFE